MKKLNIKLPKAYKPSEDEKYMNDLQLQYFKNKLLLWRKSLEKDITKTVRNLGKINLKEADPNDRASVESELNFELKAKYRYKRLISKIDIALKRIERGTYGFCAKTFEPIGIKRLEARPVAILSINVQEEYERAKKTYNKKQ